MARETSCGSIVERFLCQRIGVTLFVEQPSLAGKTTSGIARHEHGQGPYPLALMTSAPADGPDLRYDNAHGGVKKHICCTTTQITYTRFRYKDTDMHPQCFYEMAFVTHGFVTSPSALLLEYFGDFIQVRPVHLCLRGEGHKATLSINPFVEATIELTPLT